MDGEGPRLSKEELPLGELGEEGEENKEEDSDSEEDEEDGENEEDEESYERERQRNIAANQAKLLELGLLNSSHALFGEATAARRRQWANGSEGGGRSSVTASAGRAPTRRRSSRLQGQEAKHYGNELPRHERSSPSSSRSARGTTTRRSLHSAGYRQEVYDEKHLLLLGTCETPYPRLFEKKIYDPVRGTTCHQCRQKTIDKKTTCSECRAIPGQFCGTCLQVRYGENVQETWNNPGWVCPVCRDICNCSFCRPAKGWAPTGVLAHKARRAGYPSVAHYLITTYQRDRNEEEEESPEDHPSTDAAPEDDGEQEAGNDVKAEAHDDDDIQDPASEEAKAKKNEGSETRKRKREERSLGGDDDPAAVASPEGGRQRSTTTKSRRRKATTTATATATSHERRRKANVEADEEAEEGILSYFKKRTDVPTPSSTDKSSRPTKGRQTSARQKEENGEEEEGKGSEYVDRRELKKGAVVACWADPSSGDMYWLARVVRGWGDEDKKRTTKRQKAHTPGTMRIRWFEELERKKNHFREGQEDDLQVDTVFHILSEASFVKVGSGRWRLDEDLSVYDL